MPTDSPVTAARGDAEAPSFTELTDRLDEIVTQTRAKGTSLERCLDLLEEAVELSSRAVEIVDSPDYSPRERARLEEFQARPAGAEQMADGAQGAPSEGERHDD